MGKAENPDAEKEDAQTRNAPELKDVNAAEHNNAVEKKPRTREEVEAKDVEKVDNTDVAKQEDIIRPPQVDSIQDADAGAGVPKVNAVPVAMQLEPFQAAEVAIDR